MVTYRVVVVLQLPAPVDLVCKVLAATADHFPGARLDNVDGDPTVVGIVVGEFTVDDDGQ